MRKIVLFTLLLITAVPSLCQQVEPILVDSIPMLTSQEYLKKSRAQKTGAVLLVTVGSVGLLGTLLADASQTMGSMLVTAISVGTVQPERQSLAGYYLMSVACIVGSIPLFSAAAKNKKNAKAASIGLKMESASLLQNVTIKNTAYPSIAVKISL